MMSGQIFNSGKDKITPDQVFFIILLCILLHRLIQSLKNFKIDHVEKAYSKIPPTKINISH